MADDEASASDVTLPDAIDCEISDADGSHTSDVTLPDAIQECCCMKDCFTNLKDDVHANSALKDLRLKLETSMSLSEKQGLIWNRLKADGNVTKSEVYKFAGFQVCVEALARCFKIGRRKCRLC